MKIKIQQKSQFICSTHLEYSREPHTDGAIYSPTSALKALFLLLNPFLPTITQTYQMQVRLVTQLSRSK